jgi:hypothetical protein
MLEVQRMDTTILTLNLLRMVDGTALTMIEFLRSMSLRLARAMVELVIQAHTLYITEWSIDKIGIGMFINLEIQKRPQN